MERDVKELWAEVFAGVGQSDIVYDVPAENTVIFNTTVVSHADIKHISCERAFLPLLLSEMNGAARNYS